MVRSLFEQAKKLDFKPKNNEIEFNRMKNKPCIETQYPGLRSMSVVVAVQGSVASAGATVVENQHWNRGLILQHKQKRQSQLARMDLLAGVMDGVVAWIAVVVIDGQRLKLSTAGSKFYYNTTGVCVWPTKVWAEHRMKVGTVRGLVMARTHLKDDKGQKKTLGVG
ncbi:hypothetical protein BY996DRAFT_6582002 [Phakopsora pachyrhizi]|nr:hypothetical protein BY996DRAFT_6582002 [Phakopsora pachyrhizi]